MRIERKQKFDLTKSERSKTKDVDLFIVYGSHRFLVEIMEYRVSVSYRIRHNGRKKCDSNVECHVEIRNFFKGLNMTTITS